MYYLKCYLTFSSNKSVYHNIYASYTLAINGKDFIYLRDYYGRINTMYIIENRIKFRFNIFEISICRSDYPVFNINSFPKTISLYGINHINSDKEINIRNDFCNEAIRYVWRKN